jgi:hypothetical protein
MKQELLSKMESYRDEIINDLFSYVDNTYNKEIVLDTSSEHKIDVDGVICTFVHNMLKIEDSTLKVYYSWNEPVEGTEYFKANDDIILCSLDELYAIISQIKTSVN